MKNKESILDSILFFSVVILLIFFFFLLLVPKGKQVLAANTNTNAEVKTVNSKKSKTGTEEAKPEVEPITIRMKVTAYCICKKCCGEYADGKTSIGDDARMLDGVAADPKLLPYRTLLEIPGIGIKEVDDTGGAMRESAKKGIYHIDVRMKNHQKALEWGIKLLEVKIIRMRGNKEGNKYDNNADSPENIDGNKKIQGNKIRKGRNIAGKISKNS